LEKPLGASMYISSLSSTFRYDEFISIWVILKFFVRRLQWLFEVNLISRLVKKWIHNRFHIAAKTSRNQSCFSFFYFSIFIFLIFIHPPTGYNVCECAQFLCIRLIFSYFLILHWQLQAINLYPVNYRCRWSL